MFGNKKKVKSSSKHAGVVVDCEVYSRKQRKFDIPEEKILRILTNYDEYISAPTNKNKVLEYTFWKSVQEAVPEAKGVNVEIMFNEVAKPYLKEIYSFHTK